MMEEIEALERLRAQQGLCAHGYSLGCPFGGQHKSELAALRAEVERLNAVVLIETDRVQAAWKAQWAAEAEVERLRAALVELAQDNVRQQTEMEQLRAALKRVGDDYPGSSCQRWCYEKAGIPQPDQEAARQRWIDTTTTF